MKPSELDLDALARLARLALTSEEKATFQVDVTGVEPSAHAHPQHNVWQEDEVGPGLPPEEALRNAPAQREQMVAVPKVVE